MTQHSTTAPLGPDTPEVNSAGTPTAPETQKRVWLPLLSLLLAIASWLVLAYSTGYAALVVAFLSILTGAFGCHRPRGGWRNTAITAIIASAVLVVVVISFLIVIKLAL